jgi:hypothetical protein
MDVRVELRHYLAQVLQELVPENQGLGRVPGQLDHRGIDENPGGTADADLIGLHFDFHDAAPLVEAERDAVCLVIKRDGQARSGAQELGVWGW